jgi:hypothetical protein
MKPPARGREGETCDFRVARALAARASARELRCLGTCVRLYTLSAAAKEEEKRGLRAERSELARRKSLLVDCCFLEL